MWIPLLVALLQLVSVDPAMDRRNGASGAPAGTLSGQVVEAQSGQPVHDVNVDLQPLGALGDWRRLNTDAQGRFRDTHVPAGRYRVSAQGYRYPGLFGLQPDGAADVEVRAGQDSTVALKLIGGGVIAGHVVDDSGAPVSGCTVRAVATEELSGFRPALNASTNDEGEYRVADLPAGSYRIVVMCLRALPVEIPYGLHDGAIEPRLSWQSDYYPNSPEAGGATPLLVLPGSEIGNIDFKLRPVAVTTLRVNVTPPPGLALLGQAGVQAIALGDEGDTGRMYGGGYNQKTGYYNIRWLAPGAYVVRAFGQAGEPGNLLYAERIVTIATTAPEPIELQLQPGLVVHGVVQQPPDDDQTPAHRDGAGWVMNRVGVDGAAGQAIGMVRLIPLRSSGIGQGGMGPVLAGGGFELRGVAAGRYRVVYQSYRGACAIESIEYNGRRADGNEIEIVAGAEANLRIVLGAQTATLRVAFDPDSQGASWTVAAVPEAPGQDPVVRVIAPRDSASQASRIELAPGRYHIVAIEQTPGVGVDERVLRALARGTPEVDVEAGAGTAVTPRCYTLRQAYQAIVESLTQ